MTEKDISKLISKGESQTLEFKEEAVKPSRLAEALVAMANADGGKILIGIKDHPVEITGVRKLKETMDNIHEAKRCCAPFMELSSVEEKTVKAKMLVIVTIPKSLKTTYSANGKYLIREGTTNRAISTEKLRRKFLRTGEIIFETLPQEGARYEDLNKEKIQWYISKRESLSKRKITLSPKELLKNIGCLAEQDGNLTPTKAGMLLFAKNPQAFIPHSEVLCVRFRGTNRLEYLTRKDIQGTITELIEQAEGFVLEHTRTGGKVVGFKRRDIPEYPMEAVREAIVNAVTHRDYSISGARINVFIYDDRIEIWSPGALPPGVTLEKLNKMESITVPRNETIVQVLLHIGGYIERIGSGIERMVTSMKAHRLKKPIFKEWEDQFLVTLFGPSEKFMEEPEQALNKRQLKAMDYLKKKKEMTNKHYCAINHVNRATAFRDLSALVRYGHITQVGTGRNARYILAKTET